MEALTNPMWWLTLVLFASSLGVIMVKKPVHAALCFLLSLTTLGAIYLQLSAEFIAVMQVLVYAGAILVIFMFVIILFQDAHEEIEKYKPVNRSVLLVIAGVGAVLGLILLTTQMIGHSPTPAVLPKDFGHVETLGEALYVDFFFPFEAVILLFLVAMIGALYTAKKKLLE